MLKYMGARIVLEKGIICSWYTAEDTVILYKISYTNRPTNWIVAVSKKGCEHRRKTFEGWKDAVRNFITELTMFLTDDPVRRHHLGPGLDFILSGLEEIND